jgi:hypothetical protein
LLQGFVSFVTKYALLPVASLLYQKQKAMETLNTKILVNFKAMPIAANKVPGGVCMRMLLKVIRFVASVNLATCKVDQFIF